MIMRRKATENLRKWREADVVYFCAAHKTLAAQIDPKVYEYGFLKKSTGGFKVLNVAEVDGVEWKKAF